MHTVLVDANRGGDHGLYSCKGTLCIDPCIVITTTSLLGIMCLGVFIVELDIIRSSLSRVVKSIRDSTLLDSTRTSSKSDLI